MDADIHTLARALLPRTATDCSFFRMVNEYRGYVFTICNNLKNLKKKIKKFLASSIGRLLFWRVIAYKAIPKRNFSLSFFLFYLS